MSYDAPKKTAQGPRFNAPKPKRGLLSWLSARREHKERRPAGLPGHSRPHCPAARTLRDEVFTNRGVLQLVQVCAACGETVEIVEIETATIDQNIAKNARNRSRKLWRKYRRKHGKNRRGW